MNTMNIDQRMAAPQSHDLFNEWEPLIQKYKNSENVEMEIRLGRQNKTSFDTNVGKDTFENIFRALMKYTGWETSRHSKATVYYFVGSKRLTIDEESDEQDGCTKTKVCNEDFTIQNSKYDIRLGISTETPWEYDGEEVSTEQKDKERWSFVRKNLSIDLTIIKGTPDDKDSDDDTVYQVELEIIDPKSLSSKSEIYNILHKVFDILKLCA
jgi:mRNA capping enzyme, beta chain